MSDLGTAARPLRVAIVGSGPSGFYAAEALHKAEDVTVQVDMFDRLPTPFGLVRLGVAPDHPKIKSVTRVYDKIAEHPEFRFFGNVEVGRDISLHDIRHYYHAIIYAVGAPSDRRLGIPGEHLPGSHSATEFVGWYNAHPDFRSLGFRMEGSRAVVVGNGNVAMDVTRILALPDDELAQTDIADHALETLAGRNVTEIVMLGRRGPAQAAFTTKELKELLEIPGVDVIVDPADLELDEATRAHIDAGEDRNRDSNLKVLREMAEREPTGAPVRIVLRFLVSPVEVLGDERVTGVVLERNTLVADPDGGSPRARAAEGAPRETLECDLVFRAIGYRGTAIPGLPFDGRSACIPNRAGRVIDPAADGAPLAGEYVTGWIKRGPQGIIGTNKPDSVETVGSLLEDWRAGALERPVPPRQVLETLVAERRGDHVSYDDWRVLDGIETRRGADGGRPRQKFSRIEEMLRALEEHKETVSS